MPFRAAEYYEQASKVKKAPAFLGRMAVNMLDKDTSSLEKEAQGAMDAAENTNYGESVKMKNIETAIRIYRAVYLDAKTPVEAKKRALIALTKLGALNETGDLIESAYPR